MRTIQNAGGLILERQTTIGVAPSAAEIRALHDEMADDPLSAARGISLAVLLMSTVIAVSYWLAF
jgi:hypothetical protein